MNPKFQRCGRNSTWESASPRMRGARLKVPGWVLGIWLLGVQIPSSAPLWCCATLTLFKASMVDDAQILKSATTADPHPGSSHVS